MSLTNGTDAAIVSYGPVMLSQAVIAAKLLETEGISLKGINLPWLNRIDGDWLLHELGPINQIGRASCRERV